MAGRERTLQQHILPPQQARREERARGAGVETAEVVGAARRPQSMLPACELQAHS